jgi:hypothetical protein
VSYNNHKDFYGIDGGYYVRCRCMDHQNGATCLIKKESSKGEERLEYVCLRDVPLEVRRKEAKKPLFLTRYE